MAKDERLQREKAIRLELRCLKGVPSVARTFVLLTLHSVSESLELPELAEEIGTMLADLKKEAA